MSFGIRHRHRSPNIFNATTDKRKYCDPPSVSSVGGFYFNLSNDVATVRKHTADTSHLPTVSRMSVVRNKNNVAELNVASLGSPFLSWKKSRQILDTNLSKTGVPSTVFAANVHKHNDRDDPCPIADAADCDASRNRPLEPS